MTSAAKLLANRKNASKSTGPKSEEGKARSARNATKHGDYAQTPCTPGDEAKNYRAWLENWHQEYQPAGPGEVALMEQAAQAAWRLRQLAQLQEASEAKRVRHAASRFERDERERAERLGKRLLSTTFASVPHRRSGAKPNAPEFPPALKRELEAFAQGADWLLDWWRRPRATLAVDGKWDDYELFVSIALLGRYADECLDDPELTAVCIASQATLGPVWNLSTVFTSVGAIQDRKMAPQERVLTFNHSPLTDPPAALAFLNEFVTRQIDRLTALKSDELDDLAALDRAEAIARAHFDASSTGVSVRRAEAACAAELHRSLRALEKLQGTTPRNEANAEPLMDQEVASEFGEETDAPAPTPTPPPAAELEFLAPDTRQPPPNLSRPLRPLRRGATDDCTQSCGDQPGVSNAGRGMVEEGDAVSRRTRRPMTWAAAPSFVPGFSGRRTPCAGTVGAKPCAGDGGVVEGDHAIGEDLHGLATFAGDQDRVAGRGVGERDDDRDLPIGFDADASGMAATVEQVVQDLVGMLGAGVVGRQHDAVGQRFGHRRKLVPRAVRSLVLGLAGRGPHALRAEDAVDAAGGQSAQRADTASCSS